MANMKNSILEIYSIEEISSGNTCIHKLHPFVKIISIVVYILCVVSFKRYSFSRLLPYVFFPAIMISLSEIHYQKIFNKVLVTIPFCIFGGISNIIFDNRIAFKIYSVSISYGLISFFVILLKAVLTITSVLILVSVTPFMDLTNEMKRVKMPNVIILMFEMIYRYMGVLLQEASSMYIAYSLRSKKIRGIKMKDMGSFAGLLLLRSFNKAEKIYSAMKCRGYNLNNKNYCKNIKLQKNDYIYFLIVLFFCVFFRIFDFANFL